MEPGPEPEEIIAERRSEEMLRERARHLAQVHTPPSGAEIEVMCFRLNDEQYAVEQRLLRSVQHVRGLARVPCTPPFIAGVLNVRGEVITVLALDVALGLTAGGRERETLADEARVLLTEYRQVPVGLLVDEIIGTERFSLETLDQGIAGKEYVQGIADARVVLLDLQALLADARFDVSEEVA